MLVDLRSLQNNPRRDFTVDPIDFEAIKHLKKSIDEDGFWGGVVCRQLPDGTLQIAAGHHRVKAAIEAGITKADLFVSRDMTDDEMVRVYARENATQRGNSGAARTGSVASALGMVARKVLGGVSVGSNRHSQDIINGQAAGSKGIGREAITEYLSGIPGINDNTVRQDLANLKSSGRYAGIMEDVEAEIAEEAEEAKKAADRDHADKKAAENAEAKAKAAKRATKVKIAAEENNPRVFDFVGVSKHLKNSEQIDAFRETVTANGVASLLSVEKQADLAAALVSEVADKNQHEIKKKTQLTAEYVRNGVTRLVIDAKRFKVQADKEAKEAALQRDLARQFKDIQHNAAGYLRSFLKACTQISEFMEENGKAYPITGEFRDTLATAKKVIVSLSERI